MTPEEGEEVDEITAKAQAKLRTYAIVWAVVFGLLTILYALALCCMRESLRIAINIIDASSDFLAQNVRIVLIPVVYFFIQIIFVIVFFLGLTCIQSIGKIEPDMESKIPQRKAFVREGDTDFIWYTTLFVFFGILWVVNWLKAHTSMITMLTACTYYFNSNENHEGEAEINVGVQFCFKYHLGSLAFGSFIIAFIQFIKYVFLSAAEYAEELSGENPFVKCLTCTATKIINCIETICDYINKAAYAYTAVSGDSFCPAAWNGFLLNLKHAGKFGFAALLAEGFIWVGKISIVVSTLILTWLVLNATGEVEKCGSIVPPMVIVGLVAFMCASVFLGLFDETTIAMVTCVCVDTDINDGEPKFGPPTFHDAILDDDDKGPHSEGLTNHIRGEKKEDEEGEGTNINN